MGPLVAGARLAASQDPPRPPTARRTRWAPPAWRPPEEYSIRQTLHSWAFWNLTGGTALRLIAKAGVTVHIIPIMASKGVSEQTAAFMFGLQLLLTRLGRLAAIRPTSAGVYAGKRSSKMSSHLRPRANSEATNRKSPDHASRTIVWHLCPQVLSPCANANLSEVAPEAGACWTNDCATQLKRKWRLTASSLRTYAAPKQAPSL